MEALISVVMPVYNGEKFLKEVISSVQRQTFESWEFIIINDASTDTTEKIILEEAKRDERIIYIKNESNKGVAYSLNRGLDIAKGKYIARVDADDPIFATRFEVQKTYMDQHPEIGILASAYQYDDGQVVKAHIQRYLTKDEIKASFLVENQIPHSSVMLRKEVLDAHNLRYDVNYKLEDFELWTRLIRYTEAAILKQVLLKHRIHTTSVCSTMGEAFNENIIQIVKKFVGEVYNVDVDTYAKEHFHTMNIALRNIVKDDYYKYVADEFRLLAAIEKANNEIGFVDRFVLAKVLKQKWNWVLYCLKMEELDSKVFPHLEENEFGSFRARLIGELLAKKVIKDECMTDEQIAQIFCTSGKKRQRKRIIVYGVGIKCYDYFDPASEHIDTTNFEVVAFCDRDKSMVGDYMLGKRVIVPNELIDEEFDVIAITSNKFYEEIKKQLVMNYNIAENCIQKIDELRI